MRGRNSLPAIPALLFAAALAAGALLLGAVPPTLAADAGFAQMPARVMTEGLSVEQHRAIQAQIVAQLLADQPAEGRLNRVRVALSAAEIDAIDNADRSVTPLKIGFVAPLIPAAEVSGLTRGERPERPRRGPVARAYETLEGGSAWALAVEIPGAGALRLHVEDISLPDGAELWVYTRDGEAYGPYTGAGPDGSGEFWATTVFGPEAMLQVRLAPGAGEDALAEVTLRVTEVGVVTEKFAGAFAPDAGFCGNPTCIVDASCDPGANSIEDAYAKMEWVAGRYIYTCTGGLLNDSNPTQGNFFLTANHCLSKTTTAKNVTFYWWFRTATCNGACPDNADWLYPYKTTGSSVKATNRKGDFTLLQLNSNPPAGSVFLGWNNKPVAFAGGEALHRVSNPNFGPQVYSSHAVDAEAPTCRSWPRGERIYSRDTLGATDGGSSGSPVVDASDQVVGQLSGSCGTNVNDPCDEVNNATVDGAFAYYWLTVKPFLQP